MNNDLYANIDAIIKRTADLPLDDIIAICKAYGFASSETSAAIKRYIDSTESN